MSARLVVDGLRKRYGDTDVVRGLDLTLTAGEFVGLIGPNGSGKTTLLRAIAGLVEIDAGRVCIDGVDLARDRVGARHRLGVAVDPTLLPPALTGRQVLELFASTRALPDVPAATVALAEALRFTPWFDRPIDAYSLGTRQKLAVLCGLIGEPPVLLLDEPLNGLDPLSAFELKDYLATRARDHGATVLLATHALDVAERFITRAVLMHDGALVADWSTPALAALRARGESLETAMVAVLRERG